MKREKELTQPRAVHTPLLARRPARRWMTGCAPDEEEQSSRVGSSLPQPRGCDSEASLGSQDDSSPRIASARAGAGLSYWTQPPDAMSTATVLWTTAGQSRDNEPESSAGRKPENRFLERTSFANGGVFWFQDQEIPN